MGNDINFLETNRRKVAVSEKKDQKAFYVFFILMLIAVVIFAVVLIIKIYYNNQNDLALKKINTTKSQILANQEQELDYLVFYNKLNTLTQVLSQRHDGTELIVWDREYFEENNVFISNVVYDMYGQEIQLTLQAHSVFYFEPLLDTLRNREFHEQYARVENLQLVRDQMGFYNLTVSLVLE